MIAAIRHIVLTAALAFSLVTPGTLAAQEFQRMTWEDGLSSNTILSMVQDRYGFVWIGTNNGLNRFDGTRIKPLFHDPQDDRTLPHYRIDALFESSNGTLWIGTHAGLARYDRQSEHFQRFDIPALRAGEGLIVHHITEDQAGDLWLSTWESGLIRFSPGTGEWERVLRSLDRPGLPFVGSTNITIRRTTVLPDGRLMLNAYQGIYVYDPGNDILGMMATSEEATEALNGITSLSAAVDPDGSLWFASFGGVVRFEPQSESIKRYVSEAGGAWNEVKYLLMDSRGTLWAGADGGLMRFDRSGDRFDRITHRPADRRSIPAGSVGSLYEDRFGVLWVGMDESGLARVDLYQEPVASHRYDPLQPDRFPEGHIWDVVESSDGWLILATSNGLVRWHPDEGVRGYPARSEAHSAEFVHIHEDRNGALWLSSRGNGLCLLDQATGSCRWIDQSRLPSTNVYASIADDSGGMWIATFAGLVKMEQEELFGASGSTAMLEPFLPSFIMALERDVEGRIWIGSETGFHVIHDPSAPVVQRVETEAEDALRGPGTLDILSQDDGTIWFVSDRVYRYRAAEGLVDVWSSFTGRERSGPPKGFTQGINGDIWVLFESALHAIDPEDGTVDVYAGLPGRLSIQHWTGASRTLRDGRLVFGFNDGLYLFHPAELKDNPFPPSVLFADLKVDNQPVLPGPEEPIGSTLAAADRIVLDHDDRIITIDFASSHHGGLGATRFRYRLEGLQDEWVETMNPSATYTNLRPNTYTLEVVASMASGIESPMASILVVVEPPWWATWWFRLIAASILVALAASTWKVRVRSILNTNRRLEQMVESRTARIEEQAQQLAAQAESLREVDATKSRFFSNVSHELKTPLTLIRGYLAETLDSSRDRLSEREQSRIDRALSLTGRLDRLVLQLLDLARSESNRLTLAPEFGELCVFIHRIVSHFSVAARKQDVALILELETSAIWMDFDPVKVDQIVSNLISNALKFTPEGGKIWVSIDCEGTVDHGEDSQAIIRVADTGTGIPDHALSRVFDRFYQVDDSITRNQDGMGIGLSLSHDFASLHDGTLSVASSVGSGTVFTLSLPIRNSSGQRPSGLSPISPERGAYVDIRDEDNEIRDSQPSASGARLLVVEDNDELREFLTDTLTPEFEVTAAEDGQVAWDILQNERLSIVLSDVMMPRMDGLTLLNRIRTDERFTHLPVVLLTARGSSEDELEGIEARADDFISKPFNAKILKARLLNLVSMREALNQGHRDYNALPVPEASDEDTDFLRRLNASIDARMSDSELPVADLAGDMFVSERTFQRRVKELTGFSAGAYVRKRRLQLARRLLEHGTVESVSRAGRAVGFQNVSYFSKLFEEQFGVSPFRYLE